METARKRRGDDMITKSTYANGLKHLIIIAIGLVMMYPVLWLLSSSFKPNNLIFSDTTLWPKEFTLTNYINGWKGLQGISFLRFFTNSAQISVMSVLGNVITCSLAAFAFARLDFKYKKLWFSMMLVTIMLPYHVTLVPQYILYKNFEWINTYLPLIVPKWLAHDSFFILLMVQFIRGIPKELDESATIDGHGTRSDLLENHSSTAGTCTDYDGNLYVYLDVGRFFQSNDLFE